MFELAAVLRRARPVGSLALLACSLRIMQSWFCLFRCVKRKCLLHLCTLQRSKGNKSLEYTVGASKTDLYWACNRKPMHVIRITRSCKIGKVQIFLGSGRAGWHFRQTSDFYYSTSFCRAFYREVFFEGQNRNWRALKSAIYITETGFKLVWIWSKRGTGQLPKSSILD